MSCLPVASAFSERYLGLPKPDPRAYAVRYDSIFVITSPPAGVLSDAKFLSYLYLKMANLAHRASQFTEKKFLIIHPTADGESISLFLQQLADKQAESENAFNPFFFLRKSPLPTHGQVHLPAHQREGQLHLTGECLLVALSALL